MTPEPLTADVTVVMPALDRERLIGRSLTSVSSQTRPPRQVVVVDDASTDDTAQRARDSGATVLTMPERSGSGPARNAGIATASTAWIAFLDSDDEWAPDHLERLIAGAESDAGAVMVTAPALTTGGRWMGNPYAEPLRLTTAMMLVPSNLVVTSGTMVRRDVLERTGGFRPLRRAQDLDLWLRVLEVGHGVALDRPTVTYHEHALQASVDKDLMRQHFSTIMSSLEDRTWLTTRLRDGAWSRVVWDDARAAQRERRWADLRHSIAWFARRPTSLIALGQVLMMRRRARSRAESYFAH